MEYGHVFRRGFHLCAPVILLYYVVPDTFLWLPKYMWVLIVLAAILTLEAVRLATGKVFFGLRDYEKGQLSAFAWAGIGAAIALLFFPPPFVICTVVGLGWTDPLIGEMRKKKKMNYYPALPLLVYFLIVVGSLLLFSDIMLLSTLILAGIGSVVAIVIEKPRLPVDDDFLMLVVPLIVLTLFYEYLKIFGLS